MSASGKALYCASLRFCDLRKLPLKFVIAVLFVASASLIGAQTIQTIYSSFNFTNGSRPNGLTLGNDGNFYGTTQSGGITNSTFTQGMGTIFRVTTNGTLTTLVSFFGNTPYPGYQGSYSSGLTLGNDGNLYGTTYEGGIYGEGTVFKVTTNGTLTTLVSFSGSDASTAYSVFPQAALTLGNDGNFYGTTMFGGSIYDVDDGTIFQVTTNGTLTALASFSGSNGTEPQSALTLGNDGNLYGTTYYGGSNDDGTVFQLTANGTLTALASLSSRTFPGSLTLGNGGNFYGTTEYGGVGDGTIFQVTINGTLTTLVSFDYNNGAYPKAVLTLGDDGNFYGTTYGGGDEDYGTIFQVTTNGTLTTLASFSGTNGAYPEAALTMGTDGNFYGTTTEGGVTNSAFPQGMGTVFRVLLTPAIIVQPQSQTNYAGAIVTFTCGTILQQVAFQWQMNGTNLANGGHISGATNSTLTISDISDSDAAIYSVVVSDAEGSVSSSNATLTVNDSPFFATQPLSQTVCAGSSVTFTAEVYGAPPFVFQWSFNRTPIGLPTTGTNFSSITLTNVGTNQAGNYAVQVFNGSGSLTSSNAVLIVIPQPTLSLEMLAGYPVLSLYGTLGNGFMVQYNTNLADTTWITLLSLTNLSSSPYQFLDPSGAGQPARFYRAFFSQ